MRKLISGLAFCLAIFCLLAMSSPDWGFYGHRTINRKAVFTLPQEMISFYKYNIEFLTEHAVDPDKRRYATKYEAERHYIDVDHWGVYPFDSIPRDYPHAFLKYADYYVVNGADTTTVSLREMYDEEFNPKTDKYKKISKVFYDSIYQVRYDDEIICDCQTLEFLEQLNIPCDKIVIDDNLRKYGIITYFFPDYYSKLVRAFENLEGKKILQYSADIGHYVGDAHVPLHTTENYNGQLTDQVGIHGFWESRLPELFADKDYDFLVGAAEYIPNIKNWIWDVVLASHSYLPEVLAFEKELSQNFPSDQQLCFENRLEQTIQTQCEAYAGAYHTKLDGMVELRMQDAVHGIGSVWMSAWIDAGQPDLTKVQDIKWSKQDEEEEKKLNAAFRGGEINGRKHDN